MIDKETPVNGASAEDAANPANNFVIDPNPKEEWLNRDRAMADKVADRFEFETRKEFRGQHEFTVESSRIVQVLRELKEDDEFLFTKLTDVTAVDYLKLEGYDERFAVLYELFSYQYKTRLRLRVWVDEDKPKTPSASSVFGCADWGEREVYDMFGIEFTGHPNLQRILLPVDFGSYPLRKDYPLRGRGERDDFPRLRRGAKEDL
jgi:NADH-quinone oxidoreductase subunit C